MHSNNRYNFHWKKTAVDSIIHTIRYHGDDLIGMELGVFQGESHITLLQNCPNIKLLYGVDSYKPYTDYLDQEYSISQRQAELNKVLAYQHIKYSGCKEKSVLIEEDSHEVAKRWEDKSLDFIFLDTYLSYEQAVEDLNEWYPKIKPGGWFIGHDWNSQQIQDAVHLFRRQNRITNLMSTFDGVWMWKKN